MNCRVCNGENLELVLDLGNQPWCNDFLTREQVGKEPFYPLRLVYCHDCHTVQLDYTVKKEVMFGDHTYLSGMTKTLSDHFKWVAEETFDRFLQKQEKNSILDIGSNDGTQLAHFKDLGCDVCGVESSQRTAKIAEEKGIRTINQFFNEECADQLLRDRIGPFELINAAGVFFHLEELHSVCRGIKKTLKPNGVFVVQFLYMKSIVENLAFDQIYHEHLLYYTLETIDRLLSQYDLQLFDAEVRSIHGGSVIGYVGHKDAFQSSERLAGLKEAEERSGVNTIESYKAFAKRVEEMKRQNVAFLETARQNGKRVFGMGAPVKGNTLLNYLGAGPELIECLLEVNPLRKNLYSPGMHLPVYLESDVQETPDIFYVLAWNFKKEILSKNQELIDQGVEFYFPIDPIGH